MADLISNLYAITSGEQPTTETLPKNCMAFGKLGQWYYIVANINNEIIPLSIDPTYLSEALMPMIDELIKPLQDEITNLTFRVKRLEEKVASAKL